LWLSPIVENDGDVMTLRPAFLSPAERPDRASFDGTWWPESLDLDGELRVLVPMLDQARGPVQRLALSAEGWAAGPDRVILGRRTVDVDYPTGQAPWTMTVVCIDGGTFTMRVVPPGPGSAAPDGTETRPETGAWETGGGGLGLSRLRAVR
jgi:hypothetical protein